MAEAIARRLAPSGVRVYSAGSEPSAVNPLAVQVLAEIGLDASGQRSKGVADIPIGDVDTVVTLCAEEVCPAFPGPVRRAHWPLPDPAASTGTDDERIASFRAVRDELGRLIQALFS
jgi:arsenate reductase